MVARAMQNCGFQKLLLVSPQKKWPNIKAINASANAKIILKNATVFNNINEALSSFHYVIATSARKRFLQKPCQNNFSLLFNEIPKNKKIAIVFGPENSGLSNDDLILSDIIFSISLSGEHQVLNCMTAVETAKKVCGNVNYNKISKACSFTKWPGRMERLPNHLIYYDVAHNASSISVIIDTVKTIHPEKLIIGLFCLKANKKINHIIDAINGHFSQLLVTSDEKGLLLPIDRLCSLLSHYQMKYTPISSVANGITILQKAEKKGLIGLIFGSHYIANEIYRAFEISFDRCDI